MRSRATFDLALNKQKEPHLFKTIRRHGVADLPELLSIVFSNLQRVELARAARVCQLWSPIALDYLWERIDDLPRLIRVYSPLRSSWPKGVFYFQDISNGGRWDAFWAYARRIRSLSSCHNSYGPDVIPHLLHQVKKSGYGQTFLPNLRKITFTGCPDSGDSPQFLSVFPLIPGTLEGLSFGITTPLGSATALAMLQTFTGASVEHLKSIDLGALPTSQDLWQAFTTFLRRQKRLEYLGLFPVALSTDDIRRIGYLPRLTELNLYHSGDPGQALAEACAAIGDQFPNLRKLSLINKARMGTDISVMEGLAPCRDLRAVTLMCSRPQPVTAEAIQRLGRGWPQLEKLSFQPYGHGEPYDPYEPTEYSGAPIAVLEDVALCWSETINTVSLIFDASYGVPEPFKIQGRFKRLGSIKVNHSILPDYQASPVAEFIATMCTTPPWIDIDVWAEMRGDWYAVGEEVRAIIERRQT